MKYIVVISCFLSAALAQTERPECARENRPKIKPTDCCKGAELVDNNVFAECFKVYPISNSTEKFGQGSCLMECYMNKTGTMKNGKVDAASALTQFKKTANSALQNVIKSSIDKCIKEDGKDSLFKRLNSTEGFKQGLRLNGTQLFKGGANKLSGPRCGFKGMHFMRCVELNVYQNCPAAQKVSSKDCNQMTSYFTKCRKN